MFTFLVLASILPSAELPQYIKQYCQDNIWHEIIWDGEQKYRIYVPCAFPDGKALMVPVIDGYLPAVKEFSINGVLKKRIFDYTAHYPFKNCGVYQAIGRPFRIVDSVEDNTGHTVRCTEYTTVIFAPKEDGMRRPSEIINPRHNR